MNETRRLIRHARRVCSPSLPSLIAVAIQMAGEHGQATENLRSDRGDVGAMLRKINATVAAIAEDTQQPGLMDRFRMPHGNGDTELAAKLDAFASALDELGLLPQLEEHNLILTAADLHQMAKDLREGGGEQAAAMGKHTGATASIPELLKRLRECKKTWDAIYQNTYDGDTETLTAWRSVSHVPRNGGGETPEPTPGPVNPS